MCWGSFLNVLAYRLIQNQSLISPRSFCPHCKSTIAWYDTIPLISWIILKARCRNCYFSISILYPFIEVFTTIILSLLYYHIPFKYFPAYFIFFSALIVTIRSDIETMLISRFVTLFLVPLGLLFSACKLLPLSLHESILGAVIGYVCLFFMNSLFKYFRGIDGIGEGDFELLMLIGSFTGITGCWFSITMGSFLGSFYSLISFFSLQNNSISFTTKKIPFGPFLACGSLFFVFVQKYIFYFFLA